MSCDIKSAYDNVNQELLLEYFKKEILSKMGSDEEDHGKDEGKVVPPVQDHGDHAELKPVRRDGPGPKPVQEPVQRPSELKTKEK